jgi:hypothetical protein
MQVRQLMKTTLYCCDPDTDLGVATELMWKGNCGFLPTIGTDHSQVSDVVTSEKLIYCCPDDDVQVALQAIRSGKAHRLQSSNTMARLSECFPSATSFREQCRQKQVRRRMYQVTRSVATYQAITQPEQIATVAA